MRGFIMLLLLLVPTWAWAQTPAALEQADAAWNQLRLHGDAKALAPLLADDWLLTHSDGRVQHKADYCRNSPPASAAIPASTTKTCRSACMAIPR